MIIGESAIIVIGLHTVTFLFVTDYSVPHKRSNYIDTGSWG